MCKLTTKLAWYDADHGTDWAGYAYAQIGTSDGADADRPDSSSVCSTGKGGDRCFATKEDTDLVVPAPAPQDPRFARTVCSTALYDVSRPEFGSDSIRRLECNAEFQYKPLVALQATASGTAVQLLVPGAGFVTIGPGNAPQRVVARAALAKPAFQRSRRRVSKAGVVTLRPKLGKQATRKLRKRGHLKIALKVSYSSPGGTHKTRSSKVTLRKPGKLGRKLPRPRR